MSRSLKTGLSKDERSGSWFDKLTTSECPINTLARPEPFDSPLILSLSKDEHLAQDRPVEGRAVWLVVRPGHHERFDKLGIQPTLRDGGMTGHEGDAATVMSVGSATAGRFRTQGTLDPFCRIRDK